MKTSLSFACCFIVAILVLTPLAGAQNFSDYGGNYNGGQVYEPGTSGPLGVRDIRTRYPGRVWFGTNIADQGLGFDGTYATLGAKRRLFEDFLDGRWLSEVQVHHSVEDGGFFANIGIERVFSIQSAGAEITLGAWFDYDDDQQGSFAHTFVQWGVNASIKTRSWDLIGNGYFPEGTTNYAQGDPTGVNCFLNNNIVVTAGIDSALKGFDVTLRHRPEALAFMNGSVDFGGYGYRSDLVDFFGGGRARLQVQTMRGLIIGGEIAYDDRFDVTGGINLTYVFGANGGGSGAAYSGIARDFEHTVRQDHITRYNQELVLAIDPDTGMPYNVFHVDNSADASVADGTFERAFTTTAEAVAASATDDIIFVREGFGTTTGYDTEIVLKDRQMLLGDGVQHLIPLANGTNFILCNDIDGNLPTITGRNSGPAVTLANDNVVRGFNIDGSLASGGMSVGIHGGAGGSINGGLIEDNVISGAILHGVYIQQSTGDFAFNRNTIQNNGFDGILMENHNDASSTLRFADNIVNSNGRDGISIDTYDAQSLTFLRNVTDANGRDGLRIANFLNSGGNGIPLDIFGHTSDSNNGNGVYILNGDGNLRMLNSTLTNNLGNGVKIEDWTNNSDPLHMTLISTTGVGTSTITGNGGGANAGVDVILNSGIQRLLLSNSTLDGNGIGVRTRSDGVGTQLFTNILDNQSVSNNLADGMRFFATGGSINTVVIAQPSGLGTGVLQMTNNGLIVGSGISLFSGDASGGTTSLLDVSIANTSITGSGGNGISANVVLDGALNLLVENSTISGNFGDGMNLFLNTSPNLVVNTIVARNLTMTDNAGGAINMQTFGGTFTDLVSINNTFAVTTPGTTGGIVSDGIRVAANGLNIANPAIDNRTRVFVQGTTINGYAFNGINLLSNGDAHLLANIQGNTIINNGTGAAPLVFPTGNLPFFHGINAVSSATSRIDMRLSDNAITQNFETGLNIQTIGGSTINAVMVNNNLGGNDIGVDPTLGNPLIDDLTVVNGTFGTVCLAMSNNFISLLPPNIVNNAPQIFFRLELDGASNGFTSADIFARNGSIFTEGPFGSVCDGLITAEEAAFVADGFPVQ